MVTVISTDSIDVVAVTDGVVCVAVAVVCVTVDIV
jgi:hypothetical protein